MVCYNVEERNSKLFFVPLEQLVISYLHAKGQIQKLLLLNLILLILGAMQQTNFAGLKR